MGYKAAPGAPSLGGSFPRSFLIPGTDTSIRVGGFIDITGPYFLQGANSGNPGTPSSNTGQNGNLPGVPVGEAFIPGAPNRGIVPQSANKSRGNGVFYWSPQQSRIDIETRTPTAWGESRTFVAFDWAGGNNFSAQSVQQAGGDSLILRLRFAYGTLGGFLGGQALSNFSDADADTESMDFGGAIGGTGGQRIPQLRYTIAGPYGSAFSMSAEQPITGMIVPAGTISNDEALSSSPFGQSGPVAPLIPATCNGQPCTGTGITPGTTTQANPNQTRAPTLTAASYWSQPWGHMDFAALLMPSFVKDGHYVDQKFLGYGGHISGDVHPHWFGLSPKDDFQFSCHHRRRDRSLFERRVEYRFPAGEQLQRQHLVRDADAHLHRFGGSLEHHCQADLRLQHDRRLCALVAAKPADADSRRQLVPSRPVAAHRADRVQRSEQAAVECLRHTGVEPGRVHHHRRRIHVWQAVRRVERPWHRTSVRLQVAGGFLTKSHSVSTHGIVVS